MTATFLQQLCVDLTSQLLKFLINCSIHCVFTPRFTSFFRILFFFVVFVNDVTGLMGVKVSIVTLSNFLI